MFKQKFITISLLFFYLSLSAQDSLYIVKDNLLTNIIAVSNVDSVLFVRPKLATVNATVDGNTATIINNKLLQLTSNRTYIQTLKLFGKFIINEPIILDNYTRLDLSDAQLTRTVNFTGTMITNSNTTSGNNNIQIIGGLIDGAKMGGNDSHGILLIKVTHSNLDGCEVVNCGGDGIRISGSGAKIQDSSVSNVNVIGNNGAGLTVMWASRLVRISNVLASDNGTYGIYSDHSEGSYTNIIADSNRGSGIYIRNIFGGCYTNLTASRNAKHGILIQGMVHSLGLNWNSHNNSQGANNTYSDILFSNDASLSYGLSAYTSINNVVAGYCPLYDGSNVTAKEKYAIEAQNAVFIKMSLSNITTTSGVSGELSLPASINVK
jgi:hypothetical protein